MARSTGIGMPVLLLVGAAAIASLAVRPIYSPTFFEKDAAQYISTAQNIAAGFGISTDIAYYDLHHHLGQLPVAQTVWPPGFPLAIAAVSKLGLSTWEALLFINYLALLATGGLVYLGLRASDVSWYWSLTAVLCWFTFQPGWETAASGLSSNLAVFLALLSTTILIASSREGVSARRNAGSWLFAGLFGALAFSMHYAFAFYLGSLFVWALTEGLRTSRGQALKMCALIGLPVAIIVLPIVFRNWWITGTLTSRPPAVTESDPQALLHAFGFMVSKVTGLSPDHLVVTGLAFAALFSGAALLIVFARKSGGLEACADNLSPPILFVGCFLSALMLLAVWSGPRYLNPRYLSFCFPWVLVITWTVVFRATKDFRRASLVPSLLFILFFLMLPQYALFEDWLGQSAIAERNLEIQKALQTDIGGETLGEFLDREVHRDRPMISTVPQSVWLFAGRPTIGAATLPYSRRSWDQPTVASLIEEKNIGVLLLLRSLMSASAAANGNQLFFTELDATEQAPEWLEKVYGDEEILLYEIRQGLVTSRLD